MARDPMRNNCLLSTYYGQGTEHKHQAHILVLLFLLANRNFQVSGIICYFLYLAGKGLWLYAIFF